MPVKNFEWSNGTGNKLMMMITVINLHCQNDFMKKKVIKINKINAQQLLLMFVFQKKFLCLFVCFKQKKNKGQHRMNVVKCINLIIS